MRRRGNGWHSAPLQASPLPERAGTRMKTIPAHARFAHPRPLIWFLACAVSGLAPGTSLAGSLSGTSSPTLAILNLDTTTITPAQAHTLTAKISAEFVKAASYTVLERSLMSQILQEQGFQQSGCVSSSCAVEVGQLLGVQLMAAASVGTIGQTYLFTLRIIDVQTGVVVRMADCETGDGIEQIVRSCIPQAVTRLCNAAAPTADVSSAPSLPSPSRARRGTRCPPDLLSSADSAYTQGDYEQACQGYLRFAKCRSGTMYACYALYQVWRIYGKQDKPASADMMRERVLRECAESWYAGELGKGRE
ncbi:MAG: hypothetical protein GF331_09575 [Chitinivibrionales bacterium]|nr:hypothetical protein [Chitinivibrionales bacterium]